MNSGAGGFVRARKQAAQRGGSAALAAHDTA